jgi:glycosyltransferase involved in cell wall biosynthesis
MRVGIDGYNLAMLRGTGVATYARTLARTVAQLDFPIDLIYGLSVSQNSPTDLRETLFFERLGEGEDSGAQLKLTLRRALARALIKPFARDLVSIPFTGRVMAEGLSQQLPDFDRLFTLGGLFTISARYFRRYKKFMTVRVPNPPEIMHWTYPVPIKLAGSSNIYTIHDLVPLRLPHTSLEDKRYYDALIRECVSTADHIVTVSESSRRDIQNLFSISPDRLTNTYQPIDIPPEAPNEAEFKARIERLFDLSPGQYFLFFGAIEPKKNVGRIIEAYLSSGISTPLVIVGAGGWHSDRELRVLNGAHGKKLAGANRIRVVDYLPRPLLIELIRGARAVLFPSLYEGFGLPAAEALALGAPLLTSNTGSLPEVAGDAALLVDPYDVRALTAAICRLDGDSALRAKLAAAGPVQASNFSNTRYQQAIAQLYRTVSEI